MLGGKVTILVADKLKLSSFWVDDLHIASEIFVPIDPRKVTEGLVGNLCYIKLVVANSEEVIIYVLKDCIGD